MRPPAQLWRCEHPAPDLSDLARVVRRYLNRPGARTITHLTPLEAALAPHPHVQETP